MARRSHTNSTRTIAERLRGSLWAPVVFMTVVLTAAAVLVAIQTRRPVSADEVDCRQAKCVALTFDDGPSPFTDRLLDVLNAEGAKATFFLIGNKVARDPAAAKRIVDAGMEIGSHTWEHPNMSTIAPDEIPRQLSAATTAIAAATGAAPKIYRPAGRAFECRGAR